MNPTETIPATPTDEETRAVIDKLLTGRPINPELKERIHRRAERITEEVRAKYGLVDIAVPSIRELRGELPE